MKEKNFLIINNRDLINVFLRSNLLQGSWNFERMQALGFCYTLIPIIEKLYNKNNNLKKEALKRHLEFFNTHPYVASVIIGVTIALEEKKSIGCEELGKKNNIDSSFINGIKVGLMGPLAGIGDSVFWATIRPVLSAISASISLTGNFFGPIIFFIFFNFLRIFVKYYGIIYGYKKGMNFISDIKNNFFNKINEASSIFGLFIMGALVNKWTRINIPIVLYKINNNGLIKHITVQNILDEIMPGLIPILLTFVCMWALKKEFKPIFLIFIIFLFGIIGSSIGILN